VQYMRLQKQKEKSQAKSQKENEKEIIFRPKFFSLEGGHIVSLICSQCWPG